MSYTEIRFNNYAKKIGRRGTYDWYQWRVFVDGDDSTLDRIKQVTYILHPTFPNPIQVVNDRGSKFALNSSGWGSFTMSIVIEFKDGKEEQAKYFLDLGKKWPE